MLIDFGLATHVDDPDLPGATPAYLPPEVLSGGAPSAAMDWYALGLVLRGLPISSPRLDRMIADLTEPAPRTRLDLVRTRRSRREDAPPAALPRQLPLTGRDDEIAGVERAVAAALDGRAPAVVHVHGAEGSGRTRLVTEVVHRIRTRGGVAVAEPEDFIPARTLERLAVDLGVRLETVRRGAEDRGGAVLGPVRIWAGDRDVVIALGTPATTSPHGRRLLRDIRTWWSTAAPEQRRGLAIIACGASRKRHEATVTLPPLRVADVAGLLTRALPGMQDLGEDAPAAMLLHELTEGLPGRLDGLLRRAIDNGGLAAAGGRLSVDRRRVADAAHVEAPAEEEPAPPEPCLDDPDAVLAAARRRLENGLPHEALETLEPLHLAHDHPRWLDAVLATVEAHRATGRPDTAASWARQALEDALPHDRARLLGELAYVELLAGDARSALEAARGGASEAVDADTRARALMLEGVARQRLSDGDAAAAFDAAATLYEQVGNRRAHASCLGNRGMLDIELGHVRRAVSHLRRAVAVLEEEGEAHQLAAAMTNLGIALLRARDPAGSVAAHGRAAELFALSGDTSRAWSAVASRGIAWREHGVLGAAHRDLRAAHGALEDSDLRARVLCAGHLARTAALLGRRRSARRYAAEGLRLARRAPDRRNRMTMREAASFTQRWTRDGVTGIAALADEPSEAARGLRDAEPATRWRALAAAVIVGARRGGRRRARRALRRLDHALRRGEQDMTTVQTNVFRTLVVQRVQAELREALNGLLEPSSGEAPEIRSLLDELAHRRGPSRWRALARALFDRTPAQRLIVVRGDADEHEVASSYARGGGEVADAAAQVSRLLLRETLLIGRPQFVTDAGMDDKFGFAQSVRSLGLRSVACLPLHHAGRVCGALWIDDPTQAGTLDDSAPVLELLASVAGLVLMGGEEDGGEEALRDELTSRELELETRTRELRQAERRLGKGVIVGRSAALDSVNTMIERVAPTDLSVLVNGETGTGKELAAEAIHGRSTRRTRPFVALNCAALPENLAESELFGHEKGAFTGAVKAEPGLFRLADKGTLFLDEVGELAPSLQAKLLRALQEGVVRPVGGKEHRVDVRVIAATNRPLRDSADFRQDLYFRLAGVTVTMPPLRDRRDDIPLLVRHFLELAGVGDRQLEKWALDALCDYRWPGNVRELKNVMDRLVLLSDDVIRLTDLPQDIWEFTGEAPRPLAAIEADAVQHAVRYTGGEKKEAARLLGISRTTLYKKLKELGSEIA